MGNKALVVIDIQEDYTGVNANSKIRYDNADELIIKVNKIIGKCVRNNVKVIYIKHEFNGIISGILSKIFARGSVVKGAAGCNLDKRINIVSENCYTKTKMSAFSNIEFKKCLEQNEISELFLVGLDGQFCVSATAKSAAKLKYKVNVIKDAVLFKNEKKKKEVYDELECQGISVISKSEFLC